MGSDPIAKRKWYLNLKKDPVRYRAFLDYGNKWSADRRKKRPKKYILFLERRCLRRSANIFQYRAKDNAQYQKLKSRPDAYAENLRKKKERHAEQMKWLKEHPVEYEKWRLNQIGYRRYWRIIKAERDRQSAL